MLKLDSKMVLDQSAVLHGLAKLWITEQVLLSNVIEREEPIHTSVLALMTGNHHFTLGPPGTAKSQLSHYLAAAFAEYWEDEDFYFRKLCTRTMEPDELFGPRSLKGLEQEDYRRAVDGYLPTARIYHADEIWKCSDAVLNNKLDVLNERLFRNGRTMLNVPLFSMFASSNELPENAALAALYQRIAFRHNVEYVKEPENFYKMLKMAVAGFSSPPTGSIKLTAPELLQVQQAVLRVGFDQEVMRGLWAIRNELRNGGFLSAMDDRLACWFVDIARAEALYKSFSRVAFEYMDEQGYAVEDYEDASVVAAALLGTDKKKGALKGWKLEAVKADLEDYAPIRHCLWSKVSEISKVGQIVLSIAAPMAESLQMKLESANKLVHDLEKAYRAEGKDDKAKMDMALDGNQEMTKLVKALEKDLSEQDEPGRRRLVQGVLDKVRSSQARIISEFLGVDLTKL